MENSDDFKGEEKRCDKCDTNDGYDTTNDTTNDGYDTTKIEVENEKKITQKNKREMISFKKLCNNYINYLYIYINHFDRIERRLKEIKNG
ncbi:MAG: hypothetical protein ACOC1P_02865 [Minisyncoccales bacterium]